MAMSKRSFVLLMCLILGVVIGAVVFIVIQLNKDGGEKTDETATDEDVKILENPESSIDPGKAAMMCESILNGTEPTLGAFNHPDMYQGALGVNTIGVRVATDHANMDTYQKNSYWLTGDQFADRQAISMIREEACRDKIPVIVIKMRPRKGLTLSRNIQVWNHYKPQQILETWEDYDKRLNQYLKFLAPVPAIVILEPDLLMFAYDTKNLQYEWLNNKFKEAFFIRAQRVIKMMARSWVYVDAGNAAYLRVRENMEKMSKSLLRLDGLRGFSINTEHFFNTSYTNMIARRLHCLTGLHYVTDTSRNGGPFSRQSTTGIEKCVFDPPRVLRGLPPGWSWGIKLVPRQKRSNRGGWDMSNGGAGPTQQRPQQTHSPTSRSLQMTPMGNGAPPDPQEDPEGYNNYINSMRNGNNNNNNHNNNLNGGNAVHNFGASQSGSVAQPQPNNIQPNNNRNSNNNNYANPNRGPVAPPQQDSDLNMPAGRVPINVITPPSTTRTPIRSVELRSKEEALAILRSKVMVRGRCLMMEPVTVHDANVWIKAPGEADGRLYPWGTYHKCLLGHTRTCETECRLIMNTDYDERVEKCGCGQKNTNSDSAPRDNPGVYFPGPDSDESFSSNDSPGYAASDGGNPNAHSPQGNSDIPSSYSSLSEILARGGGKR